MINFFRKNRKKEADNHNYLKYTRYAIGEIALVVIGILIALQINNWNEDRKTKKITNEYLINIKNDLIEDISGINKLISSGENWKKRVSEYYQYYDQKQWTVQQIVDSCKSTGFALYNYMPLNTTYNDMLSSGKTSLLDEKIRKKLALLKKEQDLLYIISEHLIADTKTNLHEAEKYWNMENSVYFKSALPLRTQIEDIKDDPIFFQEGDLLRGLKFHHNIFHWTHKSIFFQRTRGDRIKSQSDEIIKEINKKLEL